MTFGRPLALATAGVYLGNLHAHRSYSDGSYTPAEAYAHARDTAGLEFLGASGDHEDGKLAPAT
jgi:hypothetical protein